LDPDDDPELRDEVKTVIEIDPKTYSKVLSSNTDKIYVVHSYSHKEGTYGSFEEIRRKLSGMVEFVEMNPYREEMKDLIANKYAGTKAPFLVIYPPGE
jgi:hypothetical protein